MFDVIPAGIISLFRGLEAQAYVPVMHDITETHVGRSCFSKKDSNKTICHLLQQELTTVPSSLSFWSIHVKDICWDKVWLLPHKYCLVNKVREISFKLIHRIYLSNHYLQRLKTDIDITCTFYKAQSKQLNTYFGHVLIPKHFGPDYTDIL